MQYFYICSESFFFLIELFLFFCLGMGLSHLTLIPDAFAQNGFADNKAHLLNTIQIEGLVHTNREVIVRLLPRSLPDEFTDAEIKEFERRIRNLGLFDQVEVTHDGQIVRVEVHEKITLAPILDVTTGSSVKDINATVGLVEYNLLGTGTKLGGQFKYSQRGPNIDVWLSQHPFEPE